MHLNENITIDKENIKVVSNVKILGAHIDSKLNFNYCPLVWIFSSKRSLNRIENLQKRALCFVLDDYNSSYELLFENSGKTTMNFARERLLCIEVYKNLNSLIPCFL